MAYTPRLPRWAHQDEALAAIRGTHAFGLFAEMRTGKTKVTLDEFGEKEATGFVKNLLVVAPAGVYRTWIGDAEKHLSEELASRLKIFLWESSLSSLKRKELRRAATKPDGRPKLLLVNIEALSTVEKARELCVEFLGSAPTMMVIDESATIKAIAAKRTKFCLEIASLAKVRRILSGLPTPQSPLDIFSQFAFLDRSFLGYGTFAAFRRQYAVMDRVPFGPGRRMIDVVKGYQNLEELQKKIAQHSFRVKLEDCYDLPAKMYIRRDVEMTKEQAHHYANIREFATSALSMEDRVTATIVLTQLLRLHQILAGHVKTDDGKYVDIPENKTDELLQVLEGYGGKAIIWVAYDRDVYKLTKVLSEIYGSASVARFWGGNPDTRESEEAAFKDDPNCRFMIATASAGGRGRTWAGADLMIYYSNTFSLEHRMQSEERAQLVGKKVSVGYVDLVVRESVEEKILHALRSKMSLSDAILSDGWREWVV